MRARASDAIVRPLTLDLAALRAALHPEPVTVASLPAKLRSDWLRPDGTARLQVLPKADPNDTAAMAGFARAVLSVIPGASGTAITLLESQRTVVRAFVMAGIFAVLAIAVILFVALRRIGDVLLTLVPLLVAGAVTLEVTVIIGQPLNFANHHRPAAAAGRGGGVQDLLHPGLAAGCDQAAAVHVDPGGVLLGADDHDGVWQLVAVEPARHGVDGQADGTGAVVHAGGGGAVPAGADGAAAACGRGAASRARVGRLNVQPGPALPLRGTVAPLPFNEGVKRTTVLLWGSGRSPDFCPADCLRNGLEPDDIALQSSWRRSAGPGCARGRTGFERRGSACRFAVARRR